ncbi:protein kinase domain-containing protein [Paractinoplanes brasiliensis]|uniref:Serine/threonine protein kinase n=1 Tax=Paractinoplanes brasiliensis TaxID=52695 RepID=A0A4R6K1V9_9ACTN|nr:protein kinase [Actinoplanes brasiliensis]TDO42111.1 serine/threonine protein kinase [Actinoplanes brasiliensis]GID32026.1 hypothetical protein Abr02nite_70090 [Actinoplanes brasiliensis]
MTYPAPEADAPVTVLDPGRRRPDDGDITLLDPGRSRPAVPEGLPPALHARFTVLRRLDRTGAEADVYLVQERASGAERVLKLYRGPGPEPAVRTFLANKQSRHVVTVTEAGTADDRGYEVMEHLAGGSLAELRHDDPARLGAEALTGLVRQLTDALTEVHANGIVHRDVKPANILVRRLAPLEVALIDFGISLHAPIDRSVTDASGTVRYMPPEYVSGQLVTTAFDWWSLGISVLELATGQPFLDGLDDVLIRVEITSGPVSTEAVVDPRLRLLCRGLLAQSLDDRWGAEQVTEWLDGGSPDVPTGYAAPAGAAEAEVEAEQPYPYADTEYRNRVLLAVAMTANWEHTAQLLFGDDPEPLRALNTWREQFPPDPEYTDAPGEPANVRLLRLLRSMAPMLPPIYRGVNVVRTTLPAIARGAFTNDGNLPAIVRDLWRFELLPLLATGRAGAGLTGGDGLDEVDRQWRLRRRQWHEAARGIEDPQVRTQLEGAGGARTRALALSLWATVADDNTRAEIRRARAEEARRFRLPWFSGLLERPDGMWLAYLVRDHAEERAEEQLAAARRRAWLNRNRRFREWSRRQNRPVALSWAVAGVFLMIALCAVLIGVSDAVAPASDSAVLNAWVATMFAGLAALTAEAVLAWEIGGRFHPRYSTLGAAFIALGRAARSVAGRGIAVAVLLGVLAVAAVLTAYQPMVTPLLGGLGIVSWAVPRFMRWRTDQEHERAEADRGAQELLAARAT